VLARNGEKGRKKTLILAYCFIIHEIFARADSRQKVQMKIVAVTSHKLFFIDIPPT
jgi:hypothetical protein